MASRFIVASVPHTGTATMEALLDVLGVDFGRVHMGQGLPGPGQQADNFKFLIPLRDPRKVWVSYWNRDLPTDSLSYRWGLLASLTQNVLCTCFLLTGFSLRTHGVIWHTSSNYLPTGTPCPS